MKIALAAGGTGGHLYPAVAVARRLRARDPSCETLFFVSRRGREREILGELRLPFEELPGVGAGRLLSAGSVQAAAGLARSFWRAMALMRAAGVCAVVGFGAYVSAGPVLAAKALGLKILIHEQNAVMGRANRFLARFADRVARGLPPVEGRTREFVLTGIPVRAELLRGAVRDEALAFLGLDRGAFTVLVMGGSRGAGAINDAASQAARLISGTEGVQLIHLTGAADYGEVLTAYARAGIRAAVFPYLKEMEWAYAAADLAVCRCGAMTLAELAVAGVPALLIPYPRAVDDHQTANGRIFERYGAGIIVKERGLCAEELAERVRLLRDNPGARRAMAEAAGRLAVRDAAERLTDLIAETVGAA